MDESTRPEWRGALRVFRERMGGLTEKKKADHQVQRDALARIGKTLRAGPKTVPAIADETGLPRPEVLWYLMAMKRYGELVEAGRAGRYFLYALKEKER